MTIKDNNKSILWYDDYWITDMQLVKKGKCQPKKCKSACCKFYMVTKTGNTDDYIRGFIESENKYGDHYIVKNCKHLDSKNNKCKVWGKDEFPEVCKQFPVSSDSAYKHVFNFCTFKFEMQPIKK